MLFLKNLKTKVLHNPAVPPNHPPKWRYYFASPSAVNENFCCSTSLPAFAIVSVFDFGYFNNVM